MPQPAQVLRAVLAGLRGSQRELNLPMFRRFVKGAPVVAAEAAPVAATMEAVATRAAPRVTKTLSLEGLTPEAKEALMARLLDRLDREVMAIPSKYGDTPVLRGQLVNKKGTRVGARFTPGIEGKRGPSITVDPEGMREAYKRYVAGNYKTKVDPVGGLHDPKKFVEFVLSHEGTHGVHRPKGGEKYVAYENRVNRKAGEALAPGGPVPPMGRAGDVRGERHTSERNTAENKKDRKYQRGERELQRIRRGSPLEVKPPMNTSVPEKEEKPGPAIVQYLLARGAAKKGLDPRVEGALVEGAKTGKIDPRLDQEVLKQQGLLPSQQVTVSQHAVDSMHPAAARELQQKEQLEQVAHGKFEGDMSLRIPGETKAMYKRRQRRLRTMFGMLKDLPLQPVSDRPGQLVKAIADDKAKAMDLQGMAPAAKMHALGKLTGDKSMMAYGEHQAGLPMKSLTGKKEGVDPKDVISEDQRSQTRTSQERAKAPFYNFLRMKFQPTHSADSDVATPVSKTPQKGSRMSDPGNNVEGYGDVLGNKRLREGGKVGGTNYNLVRAKVAMERAKVPTEPTPMGVDDTKGLIDMGRKMEVAFKPLWTKVEGKTKTGNPKFAAYGITDPGFSDLIEQSYEAHQRPHGRPVPRKSPQGKQPKWIGKVPEGDIEGKGLLHEHFQPSSQGLRGVKGGEWKDTKAVVTDEIIDPYLMFIAENAPEKGALLNKVAPTVVEAARQRMEFMQAQNEKGKWGIVNGERKMVEPPLPPHLQKMGREALAMLPENPALAWSLFKAMGTARISPSTAEYMERKTRAAIEQVELRRRSAQPHQVIGTSYPDEGAVVGTVNRPSHPVDLSKIKGGVARSEITGFDVRENSSRAKPSGGGTSSFSDLVKRLGEVGRPAGWGVMSPKARREWLAAWRAKGG